MSIIVDSRELNYHNKVSTSFFAFVIRKISVIYSNNKEYMRESMEVLSENIEISKRKKGITFLF